MAVETISETNNHEGEIADHVVNILTDCQTYYQLRSQSADRFHNLLLKYTVCFILYAIISLLHILCGLFSNVLNNCYCEGVVQIT